MAAHHTSLGADGRVVLPAAIRAAAGLEPGTALVATYEDGRVILETRDAVIDRIQAKNRKAGGGSTVDELIARRRHEAAREREEVARSRRARES